MNEAELKLEISKAITSWTNPPFNVLREVAAFAAADNYHQRSQALFLRLLERRQDLADFDGVLDALSRQFGLFPYIGVPDALSLADAIAHEVHRSDLLAGERPIYFHREQAGVFHALMRGENVILSAPTSFGKSLIVDALVASGRYTNVVLVLPTLALVDETRRRLRRFSDTHKLITHGSQEPADRNIFVLTQERVLERMPDLPIDLFVIDEFYKLSPDMDSRDEGGRSLLLNQAFYLLRKKGAQFYMLGPNIRDVPAATDGRLDARFIQTDFSTVACEVVRVPPGESDEQRLVELLPHLDGPSIIYCQSPPRAAAVACLLASYLKPDNPELLRASEWCADKYHPEWSYAVALRAGIGLHHSQIPRSLSQYAVRGFNDGVLSFLVCTSTLIEGVNTAAKNVVLFNNTIGRGRTLDFFTFNNIKGRSGRMFRHFVGNVYLFHDAPPSADTEVDVPAVTQTAAPSALLLQMDENELLPESHERLKPYREQDVLSLEVLRGNMGVDLDLQLKAAKAIIADPGTHHAFMNWTVKPSYEQLLKLIGFLRQYPLGGKEARVPDTVAAAIIAKFQRQTALSDIIRDQVERGKARGVTADSAIGQVLGFYRNFLTFGFPKGLRSLDLIQTDIFTRLGLQPGKLGGYAHRAESAFLRPTAFALDEFGIPFPMVAKLLPYLPVAENLDATLDAVRKLKASDLQLSEFEVELLEATQEGL